MCCLLVCASVFGSNAVNATAMALKLAREVNEALYEELARDWWHEDEAVYAADYWFSQRVIQDVVQSQLFCTVVWKRVQLGSGGAAWKWWCRIPEPHFIWIDKIAGLKEWLLWDVFVSREQLL